MTTSVARKRLAGEDGWVLVTSISLMAIMLVVALASMAAVDMQQKRSREQRERESALNMSEAVLYAQGFQLLSQNWRGTADKASPAGCDSATPMAFCPTMTQVRANIANVDTAADTTWKTYIRDNGGDLAGGKYYPSRRDAVQTGINAITGLPYTCAAPCSWDANGDRRLWVESVAIVRGRPRRIVATLQLENLREATPQTAVTAGGLNTGNKGGQTKIYTPGSASVVRCPNPGDPKCVGGSGISPPPVTGTPSNLLTPSQLERFRLRAKADGKYFAKNDNGRNTCPASNVTTDLSGPVVFLEDCDVSIATGKVKWNACGSALPPLPPGSGGNGLSPDCINTISRPGFLIMHCGKLDVSGKGTFVGVIYHANASDSPSAGLPCAGAQKGGNDPTKIDCSGNRTDARMAIAMTGGFGVWGAIAVDGNACLYAGSNGVQVNYDPNVFRAVASYGTVGLVQDTWRELKSVD